MCPKGLVLMNTFNVVKVYIYSENDIIYNFL